MTIPSTSPKDASGPSIHFCGSCGKQLAKPVKFCSACGTAVSDEQTMGALSLEAKSSPPRQQDVPKSAEAWVATPTLSKGRPIACCYIYIGGMVSSESAVLASATVPSISIALCVKILFFEIHDRQYLFSTAADLILMLTLLSGITILRFSRKWMSKGMIAAHCTVFVLSLLGSVYSGRLFSRFKNTGAFSGYSSSNAGAASAQSGFTDEERKFWAYRMEKCRPLVADAGEVRKREEVLITIEALIIREYNAHGAESARLKATSALSTISDARSTALKLRRRFVSEKFEGIIPDWFADVLRKYASTQANYAKITEERARVLKEYSETGDTSLLVGLEKINKELSANAGNALKFEKGFADLCFSPPEKRP